MEIIGHRGAMGLAPENTLESLQIAIDHGVDMIEIDLRIHKDNVVLSHEETRKSKSYPSLQKALQTVQGKVALNLEIKEIEVIEKLTVILKDYQGEILLSSFHFDVLRAAKKELPKVPIAVLEKWSGVRAIAKASLLETNRVHVNQHWLWSGFVRSMKHRGFTLYAYTVNDVERAQDLQDWGVKGIVTDYPDRFSKA